MITVQGKLINTFTANSSVDKETGVLRPGADKIQIMGTNPLESGEQRVELMDFSCKEISVFKPLKDKNIRFSVGIIGGENGRVTIYIPKGAKPEIIEPAKSN